MLSAASLLSLLLLIPVAASSSASCKTEQGACASSDDHDEDAFLQLGDVRFHVQSGQFSFPKPVMPYPFGAYDLSMVEVNMSQPTAEPPSPRAGKNMWEGYTNPCVRNARYPEGPGGLRPVIDCEAGSVQNTTCWKEMEGDLNTTLKACCVTGTDTAVKEKDMCDQVKIERDFVTQKRAWAAGEKGRKELKAVNDECMKKAMPELTAVESLITSYQSTCDDADKKKILNAFEKAFSGACKKIGDAQVKGLESLGEACAVKNCFQAGGVSMKDPFEGGKDAGMKTMKKAFPKCCSNDPSPQSMCYGVKRCLSQPEQC